MTLGERKGKHLGYFETVGENIVQRVDWERCWDALSVPTSTVKYLLLYPGYVPADVVQCLVCSWSRTGTSSGWSGRWADERREGVLESRKYLRPKLLWFPSMEGNNKSTFLERGRRDYLDPDGRPTTRGCHYRRLETSDRLRNFHVVKGTWSVFVYLGPPFGILKTTELCLRHQYLIVKFLIVHKESISPYTRRDKHRKRRTRSHCKILKEKFYYSTYKYSTLHHKTMYVCNTSLI